ncbi:MAG: MBL fold metallo-hydrolase, partial [Ferroplasma sp.]
MELQVLGTWNAKLLPGKINTSFLINKNILLDCGPDTLYAMINNGIDINKIELILITHMHLDHYGGLPQLIWQRGL